MSQSQNHDPALHVAILYRRHTPVDEQLLDLIETELTAHGYQVYVDRHRCFGIEWAADVDRHLRRADVVVPLLSESSVQSELIAFEIETANEAAQKSGKPQSFPVRVNYTGPLSDPLAACRTYAHVLNPTLYDSI